MKKILGSLDGVEIALAFMFGCIGICMLTLTAGLVVLVLR